MSITTNTYTCCPACHVYFQLSAAPLFDSKKSKSKHTRKHNDDEIDETSSLLSLEELREEELLEEDDNDEIGTILRFESTWSPRYPRGHRTNSK